MNLLLVEHEPKHAHAVSALLEDMGARVHRARSGEEALRAVLQREFAAILLEVRLPGIDGFETAAAIRSVERLRRTPIIFLSAQGDRRAEERRDPLCRFIRMPVVPGELREIVSARRFPRAPR